ncbi:MAG: COG4315 family predicted lipoprotein [Rhodospirillaceae bacterium]
MRTLTLALFTCSFLSVPLSSAAGARDLPAGMESPGAVAISEGSPGKWIFRSFPGFLPLYVFDGDRPGKSMCDDVCVAVWPVLRAEDDAKPMGHWTIISRADGRRQWAYKNHPVYTFYQDTPNNPQGVGMEENWYYENLAGGVKAVGEKVAARSSGKKSAWRLLEP